MNEWIAIDSNILVYAADRTSPYFDAAQKLIAKVVAGEISGVVSSQNIVEFVSVITNGKVLKNPLTINKAFTEINKLVKAGFRIVYPKQKTLKILEGVLNKKPNIRGQMIHDMFLAATLLSNGVKTLITENVKDFENISEFKTIDLKAVVD